MSKNFWGDTTTADRHAYAKDTKPRERSRYRQKKSWRREGKKGGFRKENSAGVVRRVGRD